MAAEAGLVWSSGEATGGVARTCAWDRLGQAAIATSPREAEDVFGDAMGVCVRRNCDELYV